MNLFTLTYIAFCYDRIHYNFYILLYIGMYYFCLHGATVQHLAVKLLLIKHRSALSFYSVNLTKDYRYLVTMFAKAFVFNNTFTPLWFTPSFNPIHYIVQCTNCHIEYPTYFYRTKAGRCFMRSISDVYLADI